MSRPLPVLRARVAVTAVAATALLAAAGCGGEVDVQKDDRATAELFMDRCAGCHTLEIANSYGSKPKGQLAGGERTNGPNFDQRKVASEDALFAIRNGGFSGAIMPANIVVGEDAQRLADFLAEYSGRDRDTSVPGEGAGP